MKWCKIRPGCKEALPVPESVVLAYFDDGEICTLWQNWAASAEADPFEYATDHDWDATHRVTHWAPLPEPPKEERKDPCADCRFYPPSSLDGKPCCACDPSDPLMNCYDAKDGE